jgi:pyrophosphatase PpaX
LGIVTSKLRAGALRGLARVGMADWFDVVIGADDVERHKPDPQPVERALARLGATPDATVFVGDSPHDLVAGRAAGVHTAAVLWGPFPRATLEACEPDYWIREAEDLTRIGA